MERWCLSRYKSSLLIFIMLLIIIVGRTKGDYIEDERKALLEIKASLHELPNFFDVDNVLSTWVDHGSTGGEICDWERIKCDTTSGHVTDLSLSNIFSIEYRIQSPEEMTEHPGAIWPLNASLFLHFKELASLDLSWNYIDNTIMETGFEKLSSLKKLEILNLSYNCIETSSVPSWGAFTSLKTLDIAYINGHGNIDLPPSHDISDFSSLENLEVLDLTGCGYYGTLRMQDSETKSILRKLKILNLGDNHFNESLISSLSALPSLKALDLSNNWPTLSWLSSPPLFPSQELSHLTNLENLDLSRNSFNTSTIQDCKRLMRLRRLENIYLAANEFDTSIISCLSFLPSLKILDLTSNSLRGSLPIQELSSLRKLTKLDLTSCDLTTFTLNGTITMSNLLHLTLDETISNAKVVLRRP